MFRVIATLLAGLLLCAQTPMVPGFPPGTFQNRAAIDAAAAPAFSLTFIGSQNSTATTTTIDYGTVTVAANNAVIVAIATFASSPSITSVTVGGVTCTLVNSSVVASSNFPAWIYQSNSAVSTGAQHIIVTYTVAPGGTNSWVGAYDLVSTTVAATNTPAGTGVSGTTVNQSLTVPAGGAGLSFGTALFNNTPVLSGTGVTTDVTFATGADVSAVLGHIPATATVTVTTGGSTFIELVQASWGP